MEKDEWIIRINFIKNTPKTKRNPLPELMSIFDPMGFLNPAILEVKLIN
jgi:Pao retrotransposon peptidase